jgi:hypothetical protein
MNQTPSGMPDIGELFLVGDLHVDVGQQRVTRVRPTSRERWRPLYDHSEQSGRQYQFHFPVGGGCAVARQQSLIGQACTCSGSFEAFSARRSESRIGQYSAFSG